MIDTKELLVREDEMMKEFALKSNKGKFMGEKWWKEWHALMFLLKSEKLGG